MSGVIGRGTHPSKIGTFRVHLTSTSVCTCIKAKWASTGSVKWWLPLHMPPLFESPSLLVSTTTSFSFSLSLSFSLHFVIPSPIRNQPLHPSLPRAFDAILCYQMTNSSENKKPTAVRFPEPTRCWLHRQCTPVSLLWIEVYASYMHFRFYLPSAPILFVFTLRYAFVSVTDYVRLYMIFLWCAVQPYWHKNINAYPSWYSYACS